MFDKILIANRGEIAVRIIRACREMGIKTVAVFSEPDREALHTQLADEAVCIGSAKAADSYINMPNIITAAVETKAQAIHPGFGFLSENSTFAAMCEECNIKFIGPAPSVIDALGNKSNAREMMIRAGVPVIPGSDGVVADREQAHEVAGKLGYPVMVKASAGGGGKGIRIVRTEDELDQAFEAAQSETKAAFGDDQMYMEKVIEHARHIEVQVLGDHFGNVIHLGERDCSLQRKNQKVLDVELSEVAKRKQYVTSVGADAWQSGTLADGRAVHLDNWLAEGARLFVKSEAHQVVAQTVVEARDSVLSRRGVRSLKLWHISRGVVEFLAVGRPTGESFEVVVGFQDVGQRAFVAIEKHEVGAEVHHLHLLSVVDVERLSRLVGREHHPIARGMPSGVDR